ncbi:MAG: hypothetical protein M1819_002513 [Sarea resinae]|nr:MAG: hypothetical protein M1819_002513 [Sarea resinae]
MSEPIRQPIDITSLERYLENNVPDVKIPVEVTQFGFGQSNPTYQLTDRNGAKYVLRKKPPGKLLSKTAHKVEREYRVIHALEKTDVPVPETLCLCEDEEVIGTPFYIMSFLDGRIYEDPSFPGKFTRWHDAIRTLAKFHCVDPKSVGLQSYGKSAGFYNRQLATFSKISESQAEAVDVDTKKAVGKIPHFDDMVSFFSDPQTQPKDRGTLVHGDYKIDNVVFHKTEPRVIGILDWEMSTIGHPLSDLANLLTPHLTATSHLATKIQPSGRRHSAFEPGAVPGLPTREQCLRWYREVTGWDPTGELTWADAFGIFRGSIIMQGIAARYALRQASSAKATDYAIQMRPYAEFAWGLVEELKDGGRGKAKL